MIDSAIKIVNKIHETLNSRWFSRARGRVYLFGFFKLLAVWGGLLPTELPFFGVKLSRDNQEFIVFTLSVIVFVSLIELLMLSFHALIVSYHDYLESLDVEQRPTKVRTQGAIVDGKFQAHKGVMILFSKFYVNFGLFSIWLGIIYFLLLSIVPIAFGVAVVFF